MMLTEKLQILSEKLQIVQFQFFTDMVIFIYIRSNSNIYWFIGIQIRCQQIQVNSYSVTFDYSYYSVSYLMRDNEGNFKLFAVSYSHNCPSDTGKVCQTSFLDSLVFIMNSDEVATI